METLQDLLKVKVRGRNGAWYTPEFRLSVQTPKDGGEFVLIHQMQSTKADLTLKFIVKNNVLTPYRG
jgi:hypothetical protein